MLNLRMPLFGKMALHMFFIDLAAALIVSFVFAVGMHAIEWCVTSCQASPTTILCVAASYNRFGFLVLGTGTFIFLLYRDRLQHHHHWYDAPQQRAQS
jgi:hypothetical protein